ncbi:MAG: DUF503 domain-containing protein [Brevinematales bacterium]|nr:DUF503 domain-containing protein [Brevinematales bacterium]
MFLGILSLKLSIPYNETIKEKRNIVRSLKDTVRKKFNVSVADVSEESYESFYTEVAIVGVSGDVSYLQSTFANIVNLLETMYQEYIVTHHMDIVSYLPDEASPFIT